MRKPTCGLYVDNIHLGSVFHHCTEVLAEIECRHDSSGRADDPVVIFSTDEEVSQAVRNPTGCLSLLLMEIERNVADRDSHSSWYCQRRTKKTQSITSTLPATSTPLDASYTMIIDTMISIVSSIFTAEISYCNTCIHKQRGNIYSVPS